MRAKFEQDNPLNEQIEYYRWRVIGVILMGLFLAVVGMSLGITVMTLKSIQSGTIIAIVFFALSLNCMVLGFFGIPNYIKSNTILTAAKIKTTIIEDDKVVQTMKGEGTSDIIELDFKYIIRASLRKGLFVLNAISGRAIIFRQDTLTVGDNEEVRAVLRERLGKKYIDNQPVLAPVLDGTAMDNIQLKQQERDSVEGIHQVDDNSVILQEGEKTGVEDIEKTAREGIEKAIPKEKEQAIPQKKTPKPKQNEA